MVRTVSGIVFVMLLTVCVQGVNIDFEYADPVHDIAIVHLEFSENITLIESEVNITVSLENQGTEYETFDVLTFYENFTIGNLSVYDMAPSSVEALTFIWNTSCVSPGEYVVSAEADIVLGETDIADNSYVGRAIALIPIEIVKVVVCDQNGNLQFEFTHQTTAFVKVTVNNTSIKSEKIVIHILARDALIVPIGHVLIEYDPVSNGTWAFIVGIYVPRWVFAGRAIMLAYILTDYPTSGGELLCPEVEQEFWVLPI